MLLFFFFNIFLIFILANWKIILGQKGVQHGSVTRVRTFWSWINICEILSHLHEMKKSMIPEVQKITKNLKMTKSTTVKNLKMMQKVCFSVGSLNEWC